MLISQSAVILAVAIVFCIGVVARHIFDRDTNITFLEIIASVTAGFVILGIPLCPPIYYSLKATNSDLMSTLPSVVPIFSAGFVARNELKKLTDQNQPEEQNDT